MPPSNNRIILFLFAAVMAAIFIFDNLDERSALKTAVPPVTEPTEKQSKTKLQTAPRQEGAKVTYVIDGDTIELETGERVRLIGIDAPELGDGEPYFSESREKLAELVLDREVRLEKDETDKDNYGRLLRYVYRDEFFINLEMVRLGYAKALIIPPDVKYRDLLFSAEREARRQQLGIWGGF